LKRADDWEGPIALHGRCSDPELMTQQKGRTTVSASVANIVLSMEQVLIAILGRVLLGESRHHGKLSWEAV
jgi:hypothetical protein